MLKSDAQAKADALYDLLDKLDITVTDALALMLSDDLLKSYKEEEVEVDQTSLLEEVEFMTNDMAEHVAGNLRKFLEVTEC